MASTAATCTQGTSRMLSLLTTRCGIAANTSTSRMVNSVTRRKYSILAPAASNHESSARVTSSPPSSSSIPAPSSSSSPFSSSAPPSRHFSKYVAVDHSTAYENAMKSQHGLQLQLALEEGKGKDDGPFDPFSQFLDQMGADKEDLMEAAREEQSGELQDEGKEEEKEDYDDDDDDDDGEYDDDDDDEEDEEPLYATDGSLLRPKSERAALRAGYPAGGTFAVIHLAGFQHKVTPHDLLVVNKLKPTSHWCVGSTHTLTNEDILLMANKDQTLVGLPGVKGAEVDVMVEEITRDKTVVVFKKRRRKNSRRKNGFRREVTFLRVLDVRMPGEERGEEGEDLNERVAA